VRAEFDYSHAISESLNTNGRWCMPDFHYTFAYTTPGAKVSARFLVVDTNQLLHACNGGCQTTVPSTPLCGSAKDGRPVSAPPRCENAGAAPFAESDAFLRRVLKETTEDYLFVVSHHPLVSLG
jgi:hypothetical protein